jgi:predicted O-methyltransferase YrrM
VRQLPASLRGLAPVRLRDEPRLRTLAVGLGLIPPRAMHSQADVRLLLDAARGARRAVEIGVYEGGSALALCAALEPHAELHLIDPFGRRPDALPSGWGASEWATRRAVTRAQRRRGARAPRVCWHVALSHEVAARWSGQVDLVFIDGDHSEEGCERDWQSWRDLVCEGGRVVFHDARAGEPGGRGLPGPTAVVARHLRGGATEGWAIVAESDRTVVARRCARPSPAGARSAARSAGSLAAAALSPDDVGGRERWSQSLDGRSSSVLRSPRHDVKRHEGSGRPVPAAPCVHRKQKHGVEGRRRFDV